MNHNKEYWNKRYIDGLTQWDLGHPSRPIVEFYKSLSNKDLKILIPGAGNAYEAEFLWNRGFKNLFILDIAYTPLKDFKKRIQGFEDFRLIHSNYFKHTGEYDLIIEQTFFCALNPCLREQYATHTNKLLKPSGMIAGVLFNFPLTEKGPPFGGNAQVYQNLFNSNFHIRKLETCYNSEPKRSGKELFFIFEKK